jgi:hypothetical protein
VGDTPEEVARERKMLERWGTVDYGRYWAERFTRDWGGDELFPPPSRLRRSPPECFRRAFTNRRLIVFHEERPSALNGA